MSRWADQCTFEHDEDRHKADGTKAGQNLFLKGSSNQYTFDEVSKAKGKTTVTSDYIKLIF